MIAGNAYRLARRRIGGLRRRTRLIAGITIAAAGVLAAGTTVYALWTAGDTFSGGTVAAGDLDLSYGTGVWKQATPGVAEPAGGTLVAGMGGFHSMPGDRIEIRVPITTTLRGDNLAAELSVDMGPGAAQNLADGVISASYLVEDASQVPATEAAELGTPVQLEGLLGNNVGVSSDWTAVVTVVVLGDYRWSQLDPLLDLDEWAIDGVDVTLQQQRSGSEFVTAGGL